MSDINDNVPFGERVVYLRKKRGWTQFELAEEISKLRGKLDAIHRTTVGKWENWYLKSQINMDSQNLISLCKVLGCDLEYLLGEIDTPQKITTDIASALKMSASSIEALQKYLQAYLDILSELLETDHFKKVLEYILDATMLEINDPVPEIIERRFADGEVLALTPPTLWPNGSKIAGYSAIRNDLARKIYEDKIMQALQSSISEIVKLKADE
jgi:transcriptional regulator with XRE-family HTH domain